MFFKIGVLKNLTIFSGKHLSWNLFLIKFQALSPITLLKIGDSSFLVNIEKVLSSSSFFYRTLPVAASASSEVKNLAPELNI